MKANAKRRLFSLTMAGVLAATSVPFAYADEYNTVNVAGGTGDADVTLTIEETEEPIFFSAAVPSTLPIRMIPSAASLYRVMQKLLTT